MIKKIIVADGFYADPNGVRNIALNSTYSDIRRHNYPGYQSKKSFITEEILEKFESLVGEPIERNNRYAMGRFRWMPEGMDTCLKVHLDGVVGWAGLVYLNEDVFCEGGTQFYSHRDLNLDGPPSEERLESLGCESYEEFEQRFVVPISTQEQAWRKSCFVAMRFNRLVLFRGSELFHSHTHGFGSSLINSRLTQSFFFSTISES